MSSLARTSAVAGDARAHRRARARLRRARALRHRRRRRARSRRARRLRRRARRRRAVARLRRLSGATRAARRHLRSRGASAAAIASGTSAAPSCIRWSIRGCLRRRRSTRSCSSSTTTASAAGTAAAPIRCAHVLDCVVDAERLLDGLRARAEAAGATLLDHHALAGYRVGKGGVAMHVDRADAHADARACSSTAWARPARTRRSISCCPTVGGVLGDLGDGRRRRSRSIRASARSSSPPKASKKIASTSGKASPAPGGRFTTYLFYYTEPQQLPAQPLRALYERFFATRARYKRGDATLRQADLRLHPRLLAAAADAGGRAIACSSSATPPAATRR